MTADTPPPPVCPHAECEATAHRLSIGERFAGMDAYEAWREIQPPEVFA